MNKESASLLALVAFLIAAIAARLRPVVQAQAPEGFQDESGFHFGSPRIEF